MTSNPNYVSVFFHDLYEETLSIDIDPRFLNYYVLGLVIGMFLLASLIYFPGKPLGISYGKADNVLGETLKDVDSPVSTPKDVGNTTQESSPKDTSSSSSSSEWAGDKIPKEQLEKLQKRFKLTDEQMKQVMQKSKQEYQGEGNIDPGAFHRQLNLLVYVIIISVLVYVINRDYKDFISFWFARYFPVEARTLGMFVPEPRLKTA